MKRTVVLQIIRLLGVALFVWILVHIDRTELFQALKGANILWLAGAIVGIFGVYVGKALRWHALVQMVGARPSLQESWRTYCIGVFLGTITPGKIGEFGKVAYLRTQGAPSTSAFAVVLLDRMIDGIILLLLSFGSLLFLPLPYLNGAYMLVVLIVLGVGTVVLWKRYRTVLQTEKEILREKSQRSIILSVLAATLFSWIAYYSWGLLLAGSVQIALSPLILAAALTLAALVSLLPLAPSGLGTRDATLLLLLVPFGIAEGSIVALSMLMFLSIILMSTIGGWYWIRQKHQGTLSV